MADIPAPNSSLKDIQAYVRDTLIERGFDDETIEQKFLLLVEEVGELAKAIRQNPDGKLKNSAHSKAHNSKEEIGDVLILLLDITNTLGIDAEAAILYKESINRKRTWK